MPAKKTNTAKKTSSKKAASAKSSAAKSSKPASRSKSAAAGNGEKESRTVKSAPPASQNRILQMCAIVVFWALALITMGRFGAAGRVLYGIFSLFLGSFTYVLLAGGIVVTVLYIWNGGKLELRQRILWGLLLLACAWCMGCGLLAIDAASPFSLWSELVHNWLQVFSGEIFTWYGFLGAGLAGIFCMLFARAGAWIMTLALGFLGLALCGWDLWRQAYVEYKAGRLYRPSTPRLTWKSMTGQSADESGSLNSKKKHRFSIFEDENEEDGRNIDQADQGFLNRIGSSGKQADPDLQTGKSEKKNNKSRSFFAWMKPLFEEEEEELSAADSLSNLDSANPDAGSGSGFLSTQLQGSVQTRPFSFEQAAGLLDQEVDTPLVLNESDMPTDALTTDNIKETKPAEQKTSETKKERKKPKAPALDVLPLSRNHKHDPEAAQRTANEQSAAGESAVSAELESLPGKKDPGISRSRPKPAENPELQLQPGENLPAAVSTDLSRYTMPKITLLNDPGKISPNNANVIQAREDGRKLIEILGEFGVKADLNDIHIGPSVTKFEITPGQGVRVNSITNLQNDIKMALAATDIRIEAPIPGKSAVGIEVPNVEKTEVSMRELLRIMPKKYAGLPLAFALGKDLLGDNVYGRLDTMPHLLIAGATGSGKSVCVNAIISSILMRTRPDEVKLILIDPKKVEFTPYNGVPHLLSPVITDGELANKALQVVVAMMDRRYDLFEETMVRNITAYNAYCDQNPDGHHQKLPRIVVIIDELADLMLAAAKEVEQSIQRITQLARAAGIHLIVATQRPSVNVITGVIKANIPSRIAFAVSSSVDSRTILDQAGAERLLGYGDMLFLDNGDSAPRRIQGVFIKDEEVMRISEYVKSQAAPAYDDAFITLKDLQNQGGSVAPMDLDPLYEEVKHFVITSRKASTSLIQRRFSIGYARAARLVDSLECNGIVGPANGSKPREILVASQFDPDDPDL